MLAKRGLCPLPKTGGFEENGLKTAKMTKITKVTHAKTLFAKKPVFALLTICPAWVLFLLLTLQKLTFLFSLGAPLPGKLSPHRRALGGALGAK